MGYKLHSINIWANPTEEATGNIGKGLHYWEMY